jgi:N-acetyl-anhydromuramyl-L-alanine amidase AmpD
MEIVNQLFETNFSKIENKNQIVLVHTSRNLLDYVVSLKTRYNGKPQKLPHYIVGQDGKVIQTLEDKTNSNYFNNITINYKSIVISLENLGWLEKQPLKNQHINWIGNIYKKKVVEKKWRDYFFWHPYTEIQLKNTAKLCIELSKKHNINLKCIGHNTKVKGSETYLGIITRSNFDEYATDVSPAFDFERFNNLLKNE